MGRREDDNRRLPTLKKTLKEIARLVDGELIGDGRIEITGVCGIEDAGVGDITFVSNPKYLSRINSTKASAVIVSQDMRPQKKSVIQTKNPSLAFAKIVSLLAPEDTKHPKGIHPQAVIGENVKLAEDIAIGAFSVIEDNVEIGPGSIIYAGCYIGHDVRIGSNTIIYPHVTVREKVQIRNNIIIHNGAVVGSDGFGYSVVDGIHRKIPQLGAVVIEDDVEIGANVTIDRARFEKTVIGKGTKIDNLVQIAHNVVMGENCIIVAQAGISGSTTLGKNVTLAGQVGLVGHIKIGDNVVVAAQSGVTKDVPPGVVVFGSPARPMSLARRLNACIQRLPKLFKLVTGLEKRIEKLEKTYGVSTDDSKRS